jgi:RNA polymerase sigma factor (sigma-70 family)
MSAPKRWDRWKDLAFSDAWLNACAGNYAINDLKKVSAIVAHEVQDAELAARLLVFVDPSADPECALMRKEDRRALNAAFARLTKRQRIAVSLRHYEDCAISEIARALNVTEGAAKNIIGRALVAMRGCLNRIAFDADGALNDFAAPPSRECSARSRTSDRQNPGD